MAAPFPRSALLGDRRHPDKFGDLLAGGVAKFGKPSQQHPGGCFSDARYRTKKIFLRLPGWALLNERPDLPFNCANLLFEVANMFV